MERSAWVKAFTGGLADFIAQVISYLPYLLAAAVVLIIGWLLARVLRLGSIRLLGGIDRLWNKAIAQTGVEQVPVREPTAKLVGDIVFWLVLLFFIAAATEILGFRVFATWLSRLAAYLPSLLVGVIIVLVGFGAGSVVRELVTGYASSAGMKQAAALGRTTQVVVLVIAFVVGLAQIGVDVSFLSAIASVVFAATLGGVALAFGFGARAHVANLIAGHQLRQQFQLGDTVRVRGLEGRVIEIAATRVVLDGIEGQVSIPAKVFEEEVAVVTTREG